MRRVGVILVLACVGYFVLGIIAVQFGWLDDHYYWKGTAIVGGVASVLGLIALVSPKLTRRDLDAIGAKTFADIAAAAEQLQAREAELTAASSRLQTTQEEIEALNRTRQEVELTIRKTAMVLLLTEQYQRTEARIGEMVAANRELSELLGRRSDLYQQLLNLGEEVQASPHSAMIQELVRQVQTQSRPVLAAGLDLAPGPALEAVVSTLWNFGRNLRQVLRGP